MTVRESNPPFERHTDSFYKPALKNPQLPTSRQSYTSGFPDT